MSENENKNRNNIYGVVSRLVLNQTTMKIFRDRDIAFYEKLKAFPQKMKDYYQQYQKWKDESPVYKEYQETQEKEEDLRCSRKTLKVWLDANSEKKVGGPKWEKKQKEYDRLEEKVEQARVKKKTEFDRMLQAIQSEVEVPSDPIAALDLLSPAPDPRRKNIYNLFGRPEDINVPYDKELGRLADYVILTILHDRKLKKERTKPINDGIWPEKEEWAESLWEELQSDNPEIVTEVNLCLDRVKEDLLAQQGSKATGEHQADSTPSTGLGVETKPIKEPSQVEKTAWESYQWVLNDMPDLLPKEESRKVQKNLRWYSKEMFDHIKENGAFYNNHPENPTPIPSYYSWARYLRRYDQWNQWKRKCRDDQPTISDQPESSVRRKDIGDKDLRNLSGRFDRDNPG